ncbi:MAG TPA: Mu transposase C-terminal domain-containing protein, partial [Candidatus Stercorousia faecigallinarum]|nr:Mu transposase C-terminal domain-containing protein [Candidatus Stercorousia faecigallinarum]
MTEEYININKIAEIKGLTSNRSLRLAIQKGKYIAREVKVFGGTSYEILYSSLEPEVQEKLQDELIKEATQSNCTALVPLDTKPKYPTFIAESAKLTALARVDVVKALQNIRSKYKTKKEADSVFLDLYNSGMLLPKVYKFLGSISVGTLHRWLWAYEDCEDYRVLLPGYKYSKQNEYNTILTQEMKNIFIKFLMHPNKFSVGKAIKLTRHILEKRGFEDIPCVLTFRRFAEHYKKNNYAQWILFREGEKAYHDKVEAYIERDISVLNVGDVLIADGHVLNFQVINPFTGKPTRATLVGFLDWKSTALVGYEIMMTENTQCIASALRNAIINLGVIPKVVYQDNGKAFKAKYFQSCDCLFGGVKRARSSKAADFSPLPPSRFDEEGFNGVYANLGIRSVFAKPYNARAKVIERFFLEFQEEFEKMMTSYIGTSIEDKPAWLKRGEKLHRDMHKKLTKNYIPTVQEAIKFIDCWLEFHNSKSCPNDRSMTIKECLNTVQKQDIDKNILNNLMMKTEARTINKHGITFLGMHYRSDVILGLRDKVYVRYSLFDLSKVHVYSMKGEFLCVAHRVQKVHPMANVLGTVKDMEEYKQQYQRQQRQFKKAKKEFLKYYPNEKADVLEIEPEPVLEIEEQPKPKRERKLTPRERQMNVPMFNSNYEKYEWLMTNGTTNPQDRKWLADYIKSDE